MQDKILNLLKKKEAYVSGEDISSYLNISRQALWKHIQELKDKGYDIEAVPHLGYRLASSPDRLFEFEVSRSLNTKTFGRRIFYYDTLTSTIDMAMDLGVKGAASGTLILAESQTKGKGRLGRDWFSPKYKGLYMSLILRPSMLPTQASILTLLAAVSICTALKNSTGITSQIKWPNDLLVNNKKLCGILTQVIAETDRIDFVIISAGINVNNDKKSLISTATSLKEQKKEEVSRVSLLQEILRELEVNYLFLEKKGASQILEKWRQSNATLGRRVKVYCQHKHIEGEALDIDTDGGLLIRKDNGITQKVMSGDVVHCR
ncbi:MAG: biotin--[acetyl-CoA-carboxylase] ligase [Candidatus Omnitrophica bacterium]|nr:biotin--[acetyl-CoA-carboxylase] ligase [Candidatus Omnitrophota bacterium]MDD5027013.1 biotin--[acetyl-CoA-carboxylase] ligase [Candidatus Omnitrophota bacterium]MDD5661765.1 biotin--[acetyl-CoA-carboxylase] ligase [Candidatus Omnitrophota bacterium]